MRSMGAWAAATLIKGIESRRYPTSGRAAAPSAASGGLPPPRCAQGRIR